MTFDFCTPHTAELERLQDLYLRNETQLLSELIAQAGLSDQQRNLIFERAYALATQARQAARRGQLIDQFLQQYGLSTDEGVTLMRLCEALIRTPDSETSYLLMRDKISAGQWRGHVGQSSSPIVNVSTRGLQLSAAWISATGGARAEHLVSKLGDAALFQAVRQAMALMGGHFVLGSTIEQAIAKSKTGERAGFAYSYDMLGEAAYTNEDADRYYNAYLHAITTLSENAARYSTIAEAPGISVKLSALHPRYEYAQREACVPDLVHKLKKLALIAKAGGIGLTIDAEEADRLEVSLMIVRQLILDPELENWNGFGVVVQAYQRRAPAAIEALVSLVRQTERSITIRLVKGAYWDSEIKRAQELGLSSYPVFTRKENTDVSYLACARQLLEAGRWVFPQFATHNAHTAAAVMEMADGRTDYEFQRLHGMGESLHEALIAQSGVRSRVYAPVGQHKDLLPYLVRRLLENGANSSFVNQLIDPAYDLKDIVRDPISIATENVSAQHPAIGDPRDLFGGERLSAFGIDLTHSKVAETIESLGEEEIHHHAGSIINGTNRTGELVAITSPTNQAVVGSVNYSSTDHIDSAIAAAKASDWSTEVSAEARAACLENAANLLEEHFNDYLHLCVVEAGKTYLDAVAEVREAIDFCRYYAQQCTAENMHNRKPLGVVACISPWNFPLAIFLGQVVAALAAGNTVIAKPAEQTPLVAHEAVRLLHRAGVPKDALHLIIGDGAALGAYLTAHSDIQGVCFTGSTRTAKHIAKSLADTDRPLIPLIAETGGLNAMLIDSTALLEQSVSDVIASAFQSAGQRCSACRIVCVQEDIADEFVRMLSGAMALLEVGDPAFLATDLGPVIDADAQAKLRQYVDEKRGEYRVIAETPTPKIHKNGFYVAPIAFEIPSVSSLSEEIFGPVLHVTRFQADNFESQVEQINALGYGLTMGLHSRIDSRVEHLADLAEVGNLYVNRNQIGAVVGVQPFGGDGLSGTGPKAGGPHYLQRLSMPEVDQAKMDLKGGLQEMLDLEAGSSFCRTRIDRAQKALKGSSLQDVRAAVHKALNESGLSKMEQSTSLEAIWARLNCTIGQAMPLPGPTGEDNTIGLHGRGVLLCLGGDTNGVLEQEILTSLLTGNAVIAVVAADQLAPLEAWCADLQAHGVPQGLINIVSGVSIRSWIAAPIEGVVCDSSMKEDIAKLVLRRDGPILPVLSIADDIDRFCVERTLTINTTAAGGNASLLAM